VQRFNWLSKKQNFLNCFLLVIPGWSKSASMKGHITVWGKFAGRKERIFIAIKRLVCCSDITKFCCTPNAIFDSRVIFHFSVCLFATQNRDFLLEKWFTTHQQMNKAIFFLVVTIKTMSALISVVGRRKQACRFHQPFYFVCRFSIASQLRSPFRN